MAEKREYIKLWVSYRDYFDSYTMEQVGRIIFAMLNYKIDGLDPDFDGEERFIWPAIRREIDLGTEAQEKQAAANRENGKKGGRPPKAGVVFEAEELSQNPFAFDESEKSHGEGKGTDIDKEKETDTGTVPEKEKEKDLLGKQRSRQREGAPNPTPDSEGFPQFESSFEQKFEQFWDAYPKKVGKVAAREAFRQVEYPLDDLLDAVARQSESELWGREDGRYIPNPATWLSQERWEDDLVPETLRVSHYW